MKADIPRGIENLEKRETEEFIRMTFNEKTIIKNNNKESNFVVHLGFLAIYLCHSSSILNNYVTCVPPFPPPT